MPYPPIVLDRAANRPLYRQIEVALRRSILDGRIGPGTVLPGIRAYAKHLGVAAVTVMTAYDQLTAEGYLEPQPGPRHASSRRACRTSGAGLPRPHTSAGGAGAARRLADRAAASVLRRQRGREPRYDFRTGSTSLDLFPVALWERLLPRAWRDLVVRPGLRDDLSLPGGRPAAARRARGLPRHVPRGAHRRPTRWS